MVWGCYNSRPWISIGERFFGGFMRAEMGKKTTEAILARGFGLRLA
jgi:hypothetical protein